MIEKLIYNFSSTPEMFYEYAPFFTIWVFLYLTFTNHMYNRNHIYNRRGRGRPILTPLYHFHSLNKHLDIKWIIAAESSPLHIASDRTQTVKLWCINAGFITKIKEKAVNTENKIKKIVKEIRSNMVQTTPFGKITS